MSSTWRNLLLAGLAAAMLSGCGGARYASRSGRYPEPPYRSVRQQSARPGPGYAWVDGYRDWRGSRRGYVYMPGRWVRPPFRGAAWVPGHWAHRRGGEVWIRSGWR